MSTANDDIRAVHRREAMRGRVETTANDVIRWWPGDDEAPVCDWIKFTIKERDGTYADAHLSRKNLDALIAGLQKARAAMEEA